MEMAIGSGEAAAVAVAVDRSQAGIRHERRHVRAKKGRDGSTVTRFRQAKPTFGDPLGSWQGTLKRVAAWCEGHEQSVGAYTEIASRLTSICHACAEASSFTSVSHALQNMVASHEKFKTSLNIVVASMKPKYSGA